MGKSSITRTYGPIHFEDLDPHRFEDLIRELIYDYKDWHSIEATGRSGNDDGFDIRAFEKAQETSHAEDEEGGAEEAQPTEGDLWMIQCKREKEIGPKRISNIISETIDPKNPPYGYILSASSNFSKVSYDTFRSELRKRGVMEFYLWGKAELEDMLHLPKNDRILFTFFGISLVSRRRSLMTEVRFVVNNKNKLFRILGETVRFKPVLVRDLKDAKYPYEKEYKDFKNHPRWKKYEASDYHPLGLVLDVREHFAYVDLVKKEWDFTEAVNLTYLRTGGEEERKEKQELQERVEDFWKFLPRKNQVKFIVKGLVKFDNIAVIDDKGDNWHKYPHIYVDFKGPSGPFSGFFEFLEKGEENHILLKGYKRTRVFPKNFPEPRIGEVHRSKQIVWDDGTMERFNNEYDRFYTFYDCDGKYNFLKPRDIVPVANAKDLNKETSYIQITHIETMKIKNYLKQNRGVYNLEKEIERQVGRKVRAEENIEIYEFKRVYDWQFDPKSKP